MTELNKENFFPLFLRLYGLKNIIRYIFILNMYASLISPTL